MTTVNTFVLEIPGDTYTATPTFVARDARGRFFVTSMSRLVPNGPFGIRLWMIDGSKPAQQLLFFEGDHGALTMLGQELWFIHNRNKGKETLYKVNEFVPAPAPATVAQINTLTTQINTLTGQMNTQVRRIDTLEQRLTALENAGTTPPPTKTCEQQLAEATAKIAELNAIIASLSK